MADMTKQLLSMQAQLDRIQDHLGIKHDDTNPVEDTELDVDTPEEEAAEHSAPVSNKSKRVANYTKAREQVKGKMKEISSEA